MKRMDVRNSQKNRIRVDVWPKRGQESQYLANLTPLEARILANKLLAAADKIDQLKA